MTIIYGLIDPTDNRCRYVGYSRNCPERLRRHKRDKASTAKVRWLKSLPEAPRMVPIFECGDDATALMLERIFVSAMREDGFDLTNSNNGGGGPLTHSTETRAKLSLTGKGRKRSSETRQRLSTALMGHPTDETTRSKISQANRGRPSHNKGKAMSLEQRRLVSLGRDCNGSKKLLPDNLIPTFFQWLAV